MWKVGPGSVQPFAFFDAGRMERLNPLRRQDPRTGELLEFLEPTHVLLYSVGAGMDLSLWHSLSAGLVWAYPLRDASQVNGTQAHESRLHFTLSSSW
jgi:hypothetical protein